MITFLDIEKNKKKEAIPFEEITNIYLENKKIDFQIDSLCKNNKMY